MNAFDRLHPLSPFCYFLASILLIMLSSDPFLILIHYVGAVCLLGMLIGVRKLLESLAYSIPIALMLTVLNPLFVHRGSTVLFFVNDNAVTAEAIQYGFFTSILLMAVFYRFRCYSIIITSEKFICLFGRILPRFALVFSMALALIPRMGRRFREIEEAQKGLGIYRGSGYIDTLRRKMRVFSILVTWALEGAVERADSMRARGYGLPHRTAYTLYRLTIRDAVYLGVTLLLSVLISILLAVGAADYAYYPTVTRPTMDLLRVMVYLLSMGHALLPILMEGGERLKWQYLKSKI